jgi:hypothetical protein
MFPQLHIFPEFTLHFSIPGYKKELPGLMFCSSQNFVFEAMDFLPCWQSQMVQSKNTYYELTDAQLQAICMHYVNSLRLV